MNCFARCVRIVTTQRTSVLRTKVVEETIGMDPHSHCSPDVDADSKDISGEDPSKNRETQKGSSVSATTTTGCLAEKDCNHFMLLLKNEQARLLAMAFEVDKYIDALTDNPEIAEETFGLMRLASGQARLLVTKKMKQFESLCHNNLNRSPEDKFPTTLNDLQGFWDIVNLQVNDIDMKFAKIEAIKNNDWKHPNETAMPVPNSKKSRKPIKNLNSVGAKPANTANGGADAAKTSE